MWAPDQVRGAVRPAARPDQVGRSRGLAAVMSLTPPGSTRGDRAAPPRGSDCVWAAGEVPGRGPRARSPGEMRGSARGGACVPGGGDCGVFEGLAATYSSAPWDAVPSALRVFTAEFGMGSGVLPLAMATRPSKTPPSMPRFDARAARRTLKLGAWRGRAAASCTWPIDVLPVGIAVLMTDH